MASPPAPVTFDPKTRRRDCAVLRGAGFRPVTDWVVATGSSDPGMGFFEPRTGNIAARAVEPSKLKSALGASAIGLGVAEILPWRHRWPSCSDWSSEPCGGTSRDGNGADYVRTHARPEIRERNHLPGNPAKFAVATPETEVAIMPSIHLPAAR